MTSGVFGSIAITDITITDRVRKKERSDYNRLKRSIAQHGLMNPVVLDHDGVLIAGEGRITACRELGWTHIPFQYIDDLSFFDRKKLELEENNAREDLSWEEQHGLYMQLADILRQEKPSITLAQLSEELNLDVSTVSHHLTYEEKKDHPAVQKVAQTNGFNAAYRMASRVKEREHSDRLIHLLSPEQNTHTHQSPIQIANFHDWAPTYTGPRFNLIHCDFPYGIDADHHAGQHSVLHAEYDDAPDIYWSLLGTLTLHLDRFCAESAHLFFWFSPKYYCETWEALQKLGGFVFEPYPLVWQRGENGGIAPDPERRPRRIYETAFFGWRNDRKIIRTKANSIVAPTERERHPHEKSETALRHFFEMCVDGNTRLFDPTCGSGSALRAARALGARDVFGLELNQGYADEARRALAA